MRLHRIIALLLKYFYMTINSFDRIFDILYWPILDLFIWGFMTIFISKVSEINLMSVVFGGFILWVFVWRSTQDIAVFTLEDFWFKTLYHTFSSPIRVSEIVISLTAMGVIRALISFSVLAILAYLVYSVNIFMINPVNIAAFALTLMVMGWGLGMFISGLIYRMGTRIQVIAWSVIWLLQPFSCVFYPLSALPSWAQPIAKVLPTTYVFENMRLVINGGAVNVSYLLYSFSGAVLILIAGAYFMYLSIKRARETGLLVRGGY